MHPTHPAAIGLRMPILLGSRAFRRMAAIPAAVLIASAISQLVYLVGPDLPNGDVWRKVGYLGLVLSLVALSSPLALVGVVIFGAKSARRAWSIRACDVVFDHAGIRVVGGPSHGFASTWTMLAPDGVRRTNEGLSLRGSDRRGAAAWLALPWPEEADERASLEALADTLEAKIASFVEPPNVVEPPDTPHCSGCGAPLRPSAEPVVACGHCGAANQLSPVLVEKVRAMASIAERRRSDSRLATALLRQPGAHAANIVAFSLGALTMTASLLTLVSSTGFAFTDGLEAGLPRLQGLPLVTSGFALATWAVGNAWLSNRRALRLLTLGFSARAPRREGEPFGCRQCGAPLPDPGIDRAIASCVYCSTPSVLAPDLRARATQIDALARKGNDPWTVLGKNRRRRWMSFVLALSSLALAVAGALWLFQQAALGAVAESSGAAEIPFHRERVLPRRGGWQTYAARGAVERMVCFHALTKLQLLTTAGSVDAVAIGKDSTIWLRDLAGERREQRIPLAPRLIAAAHQSVFVLTDGLGRFDGSRLEPIAYPADADPLIVGLEADREDGLWLTTRASRHGHLRVRRHTAQGVSEPVIVDAREPALSPLGNELAFAQQVGGHFQLVVARFDGRALGPRRQLTRGDGHIAYPTWAPNGRGLVVLTRPVRDSMQFSQYYGRVQLWLIPLEGGAALPLTTGSSLELERPLWTRDGIWFIANTDATPSERCVWRLALAPSLRDRYVGE